MAGAKISLNTSPVTVGEFNSDTSGNALVTLPLDITKSGYALSTLLSDEGTVTGTRATVEPEASDDFRARVGTDSVLFTHSFEGAVFARDKFQQNDTTATATQSNGQILLNSGSAVATGNGVNIRTYRTFPLFGAFSLYPEMWAAVSGDTATFSVTEWGLGYCSGVTAQLTDGIIFRLVAGGQLRAIIVNNGVDVVAQDITTTNLKARDGVSAFNISETNRYTFTVVNERVLFWINNKIVYVGQSPTTSGTPSSSSFQPLMARTYISGGTASAARQLAIRFVSVSQGDMNNSKPWSHQLCGMGAGAYQIQPGTTSGPNVTRGAGSLGWPNSTTTKLAGTWTATTAPAINSLGGMWTSPAISTLTTEADYPIFSFQNPIGSSALPGKTLYITAVNWGKTVAATAASTNGILLTYIVTCGGTSSATTQTEGAIIVAARGTVLDTIPFKATAIFGDYVEGGTMDFSSAPLVVYPGHFLTFTVRPAGTVASNTLTVTGTIAFAGYFE
jgi:hypothetical protein